VFCRFGIALALTAVMPPMPFTYDEPTVIWRMHRGKGVSTHAVIGPEGAGRG